MSILCYSEGDDGRLVQTLHQRLPDLEIIDWRHARPLVEPEKITAAVVWMPPEDFFNDLCNLREVYAFAAGVDQLLSHPGLPDTVSIIRLRDAGMARQMAEYALYGVLHSQRRMGEYREAQAARRWAPDIMAETAAQTGIGILGAGALGARVGKHLAMNGYPVTCWSRTPRPASDQGQLDFLQGEDALGTVLGASKVLICMLPLTETTRGILDARLFAQLPEGAFLINPGRGGHLVEDDLLEALESGHLSGALLDVFQQEPLPENHPFWTHPAIILTPHVAARSVHEESVDQIARSIKAIEQGETPPGIVDRQRGY